MFVRHLSIFVVALAVSAPVSNAGAQEGEKLSRSWPKGSPLCTDSVVNNYLHPGMLNKFESWINLSNCSHASIESIRAFAYAVSQSGGSEDGAIHSLANFANKIATKTSVMEFCIKSTGISTRNIDGSWRDTASLMLDYVPVMRDSDPKCLTLLN